MKIMTKRTMLALLLCFVFGCGAFMLFSNSNTTVLAQEQIDFRSYNNFDNGLENYVGHGCNNGIDLQVNLSEKVENNIPEFVDGFGCGSSCGASREGGYSSSYHSGCRNWQVMPIIGPMFKYWIDESTLSSLTTTQRAQFIADVDGAAAEWNSVRINDYSGAIVNLQKMYSNGIDVIPIRYNPSLSGAKGKFNPVPLFHWIEIKYLNDYNTILHEFGHMIGLQDLDMNNDPWTHISLMGYAGDDRMHYQDIQGLAVANYKHTNHDYRKYWRDGAWYNYVCFYCDITDSVLTLWSGGTQLANASSCLHTYERLASAGSRYWQKCHNCYKVIESEFTVNVKGSNSVEITGLIDNRTTITIPREIGGQNVTHIGNNAFLNCGNITTITFASPSNVQIIGNSAFANCTQLSQISIPASVTNIGAYAFQNCPGLTSISIPITVTNIGNDAFAGCNNLTIYVEALNKPNGWYTNWNSSGCTVHWNSCSICRNEFTNYSPNAAFYHTASCNSGHMTRQIEQAHEFGAVVNCQKTCIATGCGYWVPVHNFSYTSNGSSNHTKQCLDCPYQTTEAHSYTENAVWLNDFSHRAYCVCGAFIKQSHQFQYNSTICSICNRGLPFTLSFKMPDEEWESILPEKEEFFD